MHKKIAFFTAVVVVVGGSLASAQYRPGPGGGVRGGGPMIPGNPAPRPSQFSPQNNQPYNNQPYNNQPYNNQPWNNNQPYNNQPYNNQPYNNQPFGHNPTPQFPNQQPMQPQGSQYRMVTICTSCDQVVPDGSHAGQICPHCGALWGTPGVSVENKQEPLADVLDFANGSGGIWLALAAGVMVVAAGGVGLWYLTNRPQPNTPAIPPPYAGPVAGAVPPPLPASTLLGSSPFRPQPPNG